MMTPSETEQVHPATPIKEARLDVGTTTILYDENLDRIRLTALPYLFDSNYIQQYGYVTHIAQGRGATYFIDFEGYKLVLKHYWRGGLVGKINPDLYLRTALEKTRAYKEWVLLQQLYAWSLPAPKPAAIRILSGGLFSYADLLTHQIENVTPLSDCLLEGELSQEQWMRVGRVIRQFHDKGVYHDDLNAHNILLSHAQYYLIDFDKGAIKTQGRWQKNNLGRLLRSLKKEQDKAIEQEQAFYFNEQCWAFLLSGYNDKN